MKAVFSWNTVIYINKQVSVYELYSLILLVIVIDEEAIDKRRNEYQDNYSQQNQWRIIDIQHGNYSLKLSA